MCSSDQDTIPLSPANDLFVKTYIAGDRFYTHAQIEEILTSSVDLRINCKWDQVTFRTALDAFEYSARQRTSDLAYISAKAVSLPQFPPIVVDNIVSMVEARRKSIRTLDGYFGKDDAWDDLATLSLVHPSWTWSAQKAMGRHPAVAFFRKTSLRPVRVSSPLFGWWTTELSLYIFRGKVHQYVGGSYLGNQLVNRTTMVACLLRRTPNIRSLLVQFPLTAGLGKSVDTVLQDVCNLKHLRQLTVLWINLSESVSAAVDATVEFLRQLSANLSKLQSLDFLEIGPSDGKRTLQISQDLRSASFNLKPGLAAPIVSNISLISACALPIEFVRWLFQTHNMKRVRSPSKLRGLHMALTSSHSSNITEIFTAISLPTNFALLRSLSIDLQSRDNGYLLYDVFSACKELQTLRIKVGYVIPVDILDVIPHTVGNMTIITGIEDDNLLISQDEHLAEWLLPTGTKEPRIALRKLAVHLWKCNVGRLFLCYPESGSILYIPDLSGRNKRVGTPRSVKPCPRAITSVGPLPRTCNASKVLFIDLRLILDDDSAKRQCTSDWMF